MRFGKSLSFPMVNTQVIRNIFCDSQSLCNTINGVKKNCIVTKKQTDKWNGAIVLNIYLCSLLHPGSNRKEDSQWRRCGGVFRGFLIWQSGACPAAIKQEHSLGSFSGWGCGGGWGRGVTRHFL